MVHPQSWVLARNGVLESQGWFLPIGQLLPYLGEPWLRDLFGQQRFEQLRRLSKGLLSIPTPSLDQRRKLWAALFTLAESDQLSAASRVALFESAAHDDCAPDRVYLQTALLPLSDVFVATRRELGADNPPPGLPLLVLSPRCVEVFLAKGAQSLGDVAPPTWTVLEDPLPLQELEPRLAHLLLKGGQVEPRAQRVRGLQRRVGTHVTTMVSYLHGGTILFNVDEVEKLSSIDTFRALCEAVHAAGWLPVTPDAAVHQYKSDDVGRRRKHVAAGADLPQRLLRAVGERDTSLRAGLSDEVCGLLLRERATPLQVAEVFLNTFGPAALQRVSAALENQGLQPPSRWGTPTAAAFVELLGFPASFGGETALRRDPFLDVEGPIRLKPLHDFQREVKTEILEVLSGPRRRRALINLPTGAGKTRVTVQTLVEGLRDHAVQAPILWVAQSDELCEQAVQCFKEVWVNFGPERQVLRISRLWGGISRTMAPVSGHQVVVASIQTIVNRLDTDGFGWLSSARLVVIDEAHHAITPTYTRLINWLLRDDDGTVAPVIGLTATAFRGFNEEETRRLASRFDNQISPRQRDAADLLAELQLRKVLARVEYEAIDANMTFDFTAEEVKHIEQFNEIPVGALQRLSMSKDRNNQIFSAVLRRSPDTRILLFALSVRHARLVAAELTLRGRRAASIDAETPTSTRRHLITGFRDGSIPILVNYGVLTTGFDAPMTDVILIARPTFSPNLYQQMIGRGLRGPENGGKEVCHLLTVEDNFNMFGQRLAFNHFRELFHRSPVTPKGDT